MYNNYSTGQIVYACMKPICILIASWSPESCTYNTIILCSMYLESNPGMHNKSVARSNSAGTCEQSF